MRVRRWGLSVSTAPVKSTLLKIVAGLEEPDDGSVVRRRNLYIRYLPQIPAFTAGDTVLDAIVRDNRDEPHFSSREEIEASAKNILTRAWNL